MFDEDVVPPAAPPVHADLDAVLEQAPGEGGAGELTALIGVEDGRRLNRYLLQAESGSLNVPFTSAKWDNQDPQLEIADNNIRFTLPELDAALSSKRIEVVLH